MWDTNPWAKWGLTYVTRDGAPIVTETGLWHLVATHPDAVERAGDGELWLELDRPYHARRVSGRSYYALTPAPYRKRSKP